MKGSSLPGLVALGGNQPQWLVNGGADGLAIMACAASDFAGGDALAKQIFDHELFLHVKSVQVSNQLLDNPPNRCYFTNTI